MQTHLNSQAFNNLWNAHNRAAIYRKLNPISPIQKKHNPILKFVLDKEFCSIRRVGSRY
jgi:hypothetical protein